MNIFDINICVCFNKNINLSNDIINLIIGKKIFGKNNKKNIPLSLINKFNYGCEKIIYNIQKLFSSDNQTDNFNKIINLDNMDNINDLDKINNLDNFDNIKIVSSNSDFTNYLSTVNIYCLQNILNIIDARNYNISYLKKSNIFIFTIDINESITNSVITYLNLIIDEVLNNSNGNNKKIIVLINILEIMENNNIQNTQNTQSNNINLICEYKKEFDLKYSSLIKIFTDFKLNPSQFKILPVNTRESVIYKKLNIYNYYSDMITKLSDYEKNKIGVDFYGKKFLLENNKDEQIKKITINDENFSSNMLIYTGYNKFNKTIISCVYDIYFDSIKYSTKILFDGY